MHAWLTKSDLRVFLEAIEEQVVAPVAEGGYAPTRDPARIDLTSSPPHRPAKEVLFPQTSTLFSFDTRAGDFSVEDAPPPPERVLFGARPCDGRGLAVLDQLLLGEGAPPEIGYARARARTIVVGVGCRQPGRECFCTSMGGEPHSTEGLDVLFTDCGERFHVASVTERGHAWLAKMQERGAPLRASEERPAEVVDAHEDARSRVPRALDDVASMPALLAELFGDEQLWAELAPACIGCGVCTYACPTCRCFDIQDETYSAGRGRRLRVWDSCMFREYTQEAGGHNPRNRQALRWRNRLCDKFQWIPEVHGTIACVGCGRCTSACPSGVDLLQIVRTVQQRTVRQRRRVS
jgi:ferredoxin